MRLIAILVFVVGIALAGGGAYYASMYFEKFENLSKNNQPAFETVEIVVATVDMEFGHQLQGKDLKFALWPKASVPNGAFTDGEKLMGKDRNVKRTVIQPFRAGEPILESKITKLGGTPRLAFSLAEGKRAFSFSINASTAVAGFVQAGDRVDLLLTRNVDGKLRTEVFMQNVKIIAIDQETDASSRGARVGRLATIEVDPIDVQKLTIAQNSGQFSLALRGINDEVQDPDQLTPMTSADLFGEKVEEIEPVIEKNKVKVRKAGQVQDVEIE
ncbi:Flp pilus assembly protein CpaB [Rhodobacteraceae bacterium NNCM2]|nr:Flp pilus assembly protein CpaB [Coraliihabitans acroporae]